MDGVVGDARDIRAGRNPPAAGSRRRNLALLPIHGFSLAARARRSAIIIGRRRWSIRALGLSIRGDGAVQLFSAGLIYAIPGEDLTLTGAILSLSAELIDGDVRQLIPFLHRRPARSRDQSPDEQRGNDP